jgi:hypothetical protein
MDRPITTGDRDGRIAFIKKWSSISDSPADAERLRLMDEYLELSWQPRSCNCEFDFSDEPRMRRGMHLFADMVKKRYTRGHATSPIVMRQQLGLGAMLYRMKAKIDIAPIAEEKSQPPAGTAATTPRVETRFRQFCSLTPQDSHRCHTYDVR